MSGFIEGEDRNQATLFPERIDDYVAEDSPVRVVDVFIDDLDVSGLGFRTEPNATGRPSYHPKMMLKLYVYGYLSRVQSSRRLEREAQRNVELMWLTGRLAPDQQLSLTDPDARSMNSRGTGMVGYNVQSAVDSEHHLIIAHEVTNVGSDRSELANVAKQAKEILQAEALDVVADRGYYNGDEIRACEQAGIDAYLPKPKTSPSKAKGLFDRAAFQYIEDNDEYECPAGERLTYRTMTSDRGKAIKRYWTSACSGCAIKNQCTTGNERRVSRWVHADVLDRAQMRLDKQPDSMRVRRATVEHPFGTIKSWMGATHFQMKTLPRVSTEMSLHVLSYNMKRAINLLGTKKIIATIRA